VIHCRQNVPERRQLRRQKPSIQSETRGRAWELEVESDENQDEVQIKHGYR